MHYIIYALLFCISYFEPYTHSLVDSSLLKLVADVADVHGLAFPCWSSLTIG